MSQTNKYTQLNNGIKMPRLGLGVYKAQEGSEVENAVKFALAHGYRLIDTASFYENETGVGKAIKQSGVPREEIFVTTKVWNDMLGYEETLAAFEDSRKKLDLEYIDLYLIHWPVPGKFKDAWKAMEKLYKEGAVRAIGVCNFNIHHLEELFESCEIKPAVNQVEFHPLLVQKDLLQFCKDNNIQMEAWAPIMRGKGLDHPNIVEIAEKYGKTPAQVVLRWHLEHDVIAIPKSVREHRIVENFDVFDFSLTKEEVEKIDSMNKNERTGPDPDVFPLQFA